MNARFQNEELKEITFLQEEIPSTLNILMLSNVTSNQLINLKAKVVHNCSISPADPFQEQVALPGGLPDYFTENINKCWSPWCSKFHVLSSMLQM